MSTTRPISVEEVLINLDIRIATVGDKEISAECPFHPDRHPSFSINAMSGLWICYQCGESGTLEMLLQKVGGGLNTTSILRDLRRRDVGKKRKKEKAPPEPVPEPVVDFDMLYAKYEMFKDPPFRFLGSRGIRVDTAAAFGLKWDKGWVIPIWSPQRREPDLWGWQFKRGEFVSNIPKAIKKSHTLFGLRELKSVTTITLVESPLDVVRLASAGVSALAAYGAFVSRAQIKLLIETADRIILGLDNDQEGRLQTEKIYPRLAKLMPTRKLVLPAGAKDPGDLSDRQVEKVFGGIW